MSNVTPMKDAVVAVEVRAKKTQKRFRVVHRTGDCGWCHAVAVDVTTGKAIHDARGEINERYRPVIGE